MGALLTVLGLNRRLYGFFAHHGGLAFAGACLVLHWLYYLYSILAYAGVWVTVRLGRVRPMPRPGAEARAEARADGRVRTGAGRVGEGEG